MRRNVCGLGSSHFDRHYFGNRYFFLFLQVLRCFSSLRMLCTSVQRLAFSQTGSPIRTSPDQFLFADPRSFSQLTTSFLASGSQGILRSLLFSFSYFLSESLRHLRLKFLLVLPLKLQSLFATRKNSNFVILQTLISFNFLPRYLSQYCQ